MTNRANQHGSNRFDLDDPQVYLLLDPTGLRQRLGNLPGQCQRAWQQARSFQVPEHWGHRDKVVIAGMGGSAIAGDLVADLASLQETTPIVVVRDFHLPFAVDKRCLVIACSYSGNTEETLSLFHLALRSDAAVMALTSGGQLKEQAVARGIPLLPVDIAGEPRSAVPFNLMLLLGVLHRLGLVKTEEQEVNTAIEGLGKQVLRLADNVPTTHNPAKQLALELRNKLILVYGGGIFSGVARRWKTQFNENAKAWAFFETVPELLHNSVEAYGAPAEVAEQLMALLLQPNTGAERTRGRFRVVAELLHQSGISHRILEGNNTPPIAQQLGMLLLGDYISCYLALLNQVDPSPTPTIALAKEKASTPFLPVGAPDDLSGDSRA